jgi:hypothetical protein
MFPRNAVDVQPEDRTLLVGRMAYVWDTRVAAVRPLVLNALSRREMFCLATYLRVPSVVRAPNVEDRWSRQSCNRWQ